VAAIEKRKIKNKKFENSLAATKCGRYLAQIAATLIVATNEGSIAATWKNKKFKNSSTTTKCGRYLSQIAATLKVAAIEMRKIIK
jgi:hypothetical protein